MPSGLVKCLRKRRAFSAIEEIIFSSYHSPYQMAKESNEVHRLPTECIDNDRSIYDRKLLGSDPIAFSSSQSKNY